MTEFDRLIEDSLRRRANALPAVPKGYSDVNRRVVRRRRRSATMATAAVTLPAIAAFGWATTRPEPMPTAYSPDDGAFDPAFVTTTTGPWATQYRCSGQSFSDGQWTYFEYCEPAGLVPTTPPDNVVVPTYDMATLLDHVLFVDATGGLDVRGELAARLGTTPRLELPATRVVAETTVMPTGSDVAAAYQVLGLVGVSNFGSWTPDLIAGDMPDGVTAVVVLGADWPDRVVPSEGSCAPVTTLPVDPIAPSASDIPQTTLPPTTTTSTPC